MTLSITRAQQLKTKPDQSNLGFGTLFTDHMFNMDYDPDNGWHNPRNSCGMLIAAMALCFGLPAWWSSRRDAADGSRPSSRGRSRRRP